PRLERGMGLLSDQVGSAALSMTSILSGCIPRVKIRRRTPGESAWRHRLTANAGLKPVQIQFSVQDRRVQRMLLMCGRLPFISRALCFGCGIRVLMIATDALRYFSQLHS